MGKYSKIDVTLLNNDINSTLDRLNIFMTNKISIDIRNNNTEAVKLFSAYLDKIYTDNNLTGSITNFINILNKLKKIIATISKYQELETELKLLESKKYNMDGSINIQIVSQCNIINDELVRLERKIDNSLTNF